MGLAFCAKLPIDFWRPGDECGRANFPLYHTLSNLSRENVAQKYTIISPAICALFRLEIRDGVCYN